MNDWPLVHLAAITTKIGSGATPRGGKESYKEEGLTLIRSQNVYDFKFERDGLAFIDEAQARQLSNVEIQDKDILLNITGASVARCCMVPSAVLPARVNQHVAIVRINPKLANPTFVVYTINSSYYKHHLLSLAQGGATREALTKETIEGFQVPLPALSTQNKIAAVLSAYDDLIENNTRRIQLLEEMAQSLYREWFVHFRFPGHEQSDMVEVDGGLIPNGWSIKHLGDEIHLGYGKALKAEERVIGPYPVYGSSGIVGSHVEALVEGPGIIIGRKGNVGSVHWSASNFYPIDTVYFVKSELPLEYVFFNLQRQNFLNNDAAVPGLNRNQAYSLPLLIPSSHVLAEFTAHMKSNFQQTTLLQKKNVNLRRTRDLLLPKLISGEIDVSNLDIAMGEMN